MYKKILVIKIGALGDFILTTGWMAAIKKHYPHARIDLLTGPELVKMARQSEYFDTIATDSRPKLNISEYYRVCKKIIAGGKYDLVLDLQNSKRTRRKYKFLVKMFRLGRVNWQTYGGRELSKIEQFPPSLDFCKGEGKHFHLLPEKYVLMIPGCSARNAYKRWPKEKYAIIAKELAKQHIGAVVLGTSDEQEEVDFISSATPLAVNFMNKASLLDIPNLARKSLAIIGNDTGPTHMASLVGKPVIALFCQKTARSQNNFDQVINLVGQQIEDIDENDVIRHLKTIMTGCWA